MAELNIVLLEKGEEDQYWRKGEDFKLSDFGGALPDCGDVIVSPEGGADPAKHRLYVVEARYFRPRRPESHQFINVGLVVKERVPREDETHLIVGGG